MVTPQNKIFLPDSTMWWEKNFCVSFQYLIPMYNTASGKIHINKFIHQGQMF